MRASNGRIGCCPNGRRCYGPVEGVEEGASNGPVDVLSGGEVAENESKNVAEGSQDK